ncbi:MAG: methylmalonyl Co-A mutase-associated GTPase MeaB [Anaerolineales bacterium]|nr:methylmalonyl Co-A mutase-associated GTPase MeaB [Anaerolineales bacterium]
MTVKSPSELSSPAGGTSQDSILLAESILNGSRLALGRAITQVENDTPLGRQVLSLLFPHTGAAHLIGVTGAPGTGKSSLVNQLARLYRKPVEGSPLKVAIVAVDPSSPFTGGALLGDRIRMRDLAGDPGVFIRSMASRGSLGGLAATTPGVVQVLDAAGFDLILIETVGAGQSEVEIARLAHTTLVVEAPGMGDDIQAIKAGILEIADILVINKADRPGVENTERALRGMLELGHPSRLMKLEHTRHHQLMPVPAQDPTAKTDPSAFWLPPIVRTIAPENVGIVELAQTISNHRAYLERTGEWALRDQLRIRAELESILQETLVSRWRATLPESQYQQALVRLAERRASPHQVAEELLGENIL